VTTLPLAIGAVLAIFLFYLAGWIGLGRERGFYPTVLIAIASYYALFAVMAGAMRALAIEAVCIAVFAGLAIAGFRSLPWLTIGGLFAHGAFDWLHADLVQNPGVPGFWPPFCMAFDVVLGGCLALSMLRAWRQVM
jgi:hypothetical protein